VLPIKIWSFVFWKYSRDSLAFATESCFGSLANCLGCYDNISQPIPKEFEDYKLYDVEIRYGIVQVSL
jgi:SCY1-like protein 2